MLSTTTADLYDPDLLDPSEFEPFEYLDDLPYFTDVPLPPPEHNQDDLEEGLGGPGDSPVPPGEALKACAAYITEQRPVDVGMCLRYSRGWYGVGPLYVSANECFSAIPDVFTHRAADLAKVPRGVLVYFHGHQYGHIAPSFGGGWIGSTDWPSGRVGRVKADALASAWGYPMSDVYWSPVVNDVQVWRPSKPTPQPAPAPQRGPRVDAMIASTAHDRLTAAAARKYAREHDMPKRANDLGAVVSGYSALITRLRGVQPLNPKD